MQFSRLILLFVTMVLFAANAFSKEATEVILIDTVPAYIAGLAEQLKSSRPSDKMLKNSIGIGAYALFKKKGGHYQLKASFDNNQAQPNRPLEGVIPPASIPYIRTIMDPEYEGNLDINLSKSFAANKGLGRFIVIGKDDNKYAIYALKTQGKKEYLVVGLYFYNEYITIVLDKWEKKDKLTFLSNEPKAWRILSSAIIDDIQGNWLDYLVKLDIVKEPETPLRRQQIIEGDEGKKLKEAFEKARGELINKKYYIGLHHISNYARLNTTYDMEKKGFEIVFPENIEVGYFDIEAAFPIEWNMTRREIMDSTERTRVKAEIARIEKQYFGEATAATERFDDYNILDVENEDTRDLKKHINQQAQLAVFVEKRRIMRKYNKRRKGKLFLPVGINGANKIDGKDGLMAFLVITPTKELKIDAYTRDTKIVCKDGLIRIVDQDFNLLEDISF